MKNKFTAIMSSLVAMLMLFGVTTAFANASPNYATNYHNDMGLYYQGYVQ